jgi:LPS-assembly lipoprotein
MWWLEDLQWRRLARPLRLAAVLAAAGLTAGCFEPLYGARPTPGAENVQDKFAAIDIPPITAPKGTPAERVAVAIRNALQFDLHNGGGAFAPAYQLKVNVGTTQFTPVIDPNTGRPNTQIDDVTANYQLIESATGKIVVNDHCYAHVDFDIPGSEQRFAKQRAQRDAEDRAVQVVAETIRNRLASYFVAGT